MGKNKDKRKLRRNTIRYSAGLCTGGKILKVIIVICLFFCSLQAQIKVEEITTDTVDILAKKTEKAPYSENLLLLSTLILPGTGHQLTGSYIKALSYTSIDVVCGFLSLFFYLSSVKGVENSRGYAALYAGAPAYVKDEYYWSLVGSFNTSAEYIETLRLIREQDSRYTEEEFFWKWEDESLRKEFVLMQKKAKNSATASYFFIGALIINRVVSFIDLRSSMKNIRYYKNVSLSVEPAYMNGFCGELVLKAKF
ncbi:MAG: hypothetical protein N2053_01385 [Chitinispirillaceae bacterium]|nr:hypothetical protein [Chitinispirillaceae bacterium]